MVGPADPKEAALLKTEGREGSDAIAETLIASDVEIVFGYAGGAVPHLARGLVAHQVPMFAGRSEITAAWMSYGYNRAKRRAASAILTHHVGALHVAPVVYGATMDGTPLLFMAMDNPPAMEARDGLQDAVEVYPSLKPLAKYIKKVNDASDLPVIVRQAVKSASTGKFGASVLVLPQTIMFQKTSLPTEPLRLPSKPSPLAEDISATWNLIAKAKKPVFYIGAGVHIADAAEELRELAEATGIPVVSTSWGGRGVLPDDHELYMGASGAFGWKSGNGVLQDADLWISIGASFSQMSTGTWSIRKPSTVVQVDISEYELAKIFQPTIGIQSDAKHFLKAMLAAKERQNANGKAIEGWRSESQERKEEFLVEMDGWADATAVPLNQYHVIRTLSEELPKGTLVVGDSGGHCFALYRAFKYKETTPLPSGGHYMSLGSGLPIAIGAKLADPSRNVVVFHGDGGFYYDLSELSVLTERNLKVIIVIDNNGCLLANRSAMKSMGVENPWADLPDTTDFVTVAKGFGVDGEKVEHPDQLVPAIKRALASEKSYVIDVHTTEGLRIRRALEGIIPIVSDRTPTFGHLDTVLDGSWPS
jgi:acetolactate synthase-1/2/3 large subunit